MTELNTNKENFNHWFKDIIEYLNNNENAGFAILMIIFPLLERFIRIKRDIPYNKKLKKESPFYEELKTIFSVLKDNETAQKFWIVYRHGILHQASFSIQDYHGNDLPNGWLSGDTDDIEIHLDGSFWVNPVKFSQKVIAEIEEEFSNFDTSKPSTGHTQLALPQISQDGIYGTASIMQRIPPSISNQPRSITISIDDTKKKT
jgi:hypothetical protein